MQVYYVEYNRAPSGVMTGPILPPEERYFFTIDHDRLNPIVTFMQPIEDEL